MNGFIDTAVNIGKGFFLLLMLVLVLFLIGYLFYQFRHAGSSTTDPIGGIIMVFVIVIPVATLGAFFGSQVALMSPVPIGKVFAWMGLIGGAIAGFYLWRWVGTW